jgi:3-deoxy-7-phosphoheptulonate synthase
VADQVRAGSIHVISVMLESHLVEGNQKIPTDLARLTYGQSITDACINLPTTLDLLEELAAAVRSVREQQLATV